MTELEFDKLLRSALMEAVRLDFQPAIEAAEQEEIIFSRHYLKRREKMLQDPFAYAKKAALTLWQRAARTVAMILLVCSILFAAMWSVPEVRAAIKKLYMEWYETHIAVYVQDSDGTGETDLTKFHVEIPAEVLPEGYEESLRMKRSGIIRYTNEAGDVISVNYLYSTGERKYGINNLGVISRKTVLNGEEYCEFEASDYGTNQIAWIDQDHKLVIILAATADSICASDLISIAENISVNPE